MKNLNTTINQSAGSDDQTIDLYNGFYASEKASNNIASDSFYENITNTRTKNIEKLNFLTETEVESVNRKEKKNIFYGNNVKRKSEVNVIEENISENKSKSDKNINSLLSNSQFEEIRF